MHLSSTFVALALVRFGQSWYIPPGTGDGVYEVVRDANGAEHHVRLSSNPALPAPANGSYGTTETLAGQSSGGLQKRDNTHYYCGCGYNMDPGNCDAAVADLSNQFGNGATIQPHLAWYSIRGSVVAFVCSRTDGYIVATGQQYGDYLKQITFVCGRYIAGSAQRFYDAGGSAAIGYQRYSNGDDFCASSTISPVTHC